MERTFGTFEAGGMIPPSRASNHVRIRTVALPVEHGGWSLLLEPIAVALLVAPSPAGFSLALAACGAFLARHPLRLVNADRQRGRRFPRTRVAERFLILYAAIATAGAIATALSAADGQWLWPLAVAGPFALLQIALDARGRGRRLLPELAGAIALAATAPSIALAAGWPRPAAYALWALMTARAVPAILYVRARLNLLHGTEPAATLTMVVHAAALAVAIACAFAGLSSSVTGIVFLVLLLRAAYGLAGLDRATSAKSIGLREICFGAITVGTIAVDQWLLG